MSGHAIQSIVAGIVIFVVSLVLFQPMTTGADKLYREFVPHCAKGDDTTLRVSATAATAHATKGQVFSVSKKGTTTTCEITGLTPARRQPHRSTPRTARAFRSPLPETPLQRWIWAPIGLGPPRLTP